jgi:hypothetical protein
VDNSRRIPGTLRALVSLREEAWRLSNDAAAHEVGTEDAPAAEPRLYLGEPFLRRVAREAEARANGGWQCRRGGCGAWNRRHLKMCKACGKRGRPSTTMVKQALAEATARLEGPWQIISKGE